MFEGRGKQGIVMSITNILFGLEIAMAFVSQSARFGEIPEMFILREESSHSNSVFVRRKWVSYNKNPLN